MPPRFKNAACRRAAGRGGRRRPIRLLPTGQVQAITSGQLQLPLSPHLGSASSKKW